MKKHSQLWVFFHGLYYNNFILTAKEAPKMTLPSGPVPTDALRSIIGTTPLRHGFHRLLVAACEKAPKASRASVRQQLIAALNHSFGTYAIVTNGDVKPKYLCGYEEAEAEATKGDIIAMLVSGDGLESHFGAAIRFLELFPGKEEFVHKLMLERLTHLKVSNPETNARHFIRQATEHLMSRPAERKS